MNTLIIRHIAKSKPVQFEVLRADDAEGVGPVFVPSPIYFPVESRPDSDLMRELRWYLEDFLEYPYEPEVGHANRVRRALKDWGEQAFESLFGGGNGRTMIHDALTKGHANLCVAISSDGADVLSWPWEAIRDPEVGCIGQKYRVERRLAKIRDPIEVSRELPRDRVNVLLVTARPYENDARFRSISRPLVELIEKEKLPAYVHLLRPPTFEHLREHLDKRKHFYHILHFDGHGGYVQVETQAGLCHECAEAEGCLVFEGNDEQPDDKTGEQIGSLLRDFEIPVVVLNACQSAMLHEAARDPFASVAGSLIKAGIRSVVAMSYSLYVSGAEQFVPAFYRRLFQTGSIAEAVRAGRQQMFVNKKRVCSRGRFDLEDWLLPVLYQQQPLDFSFAKDVKKKEGHDESKVVTELSQECENPYGFVGRDGAILRIERAMRRKPAGILICGLGGVGKTTLAQGFLEWLAVTEGLGQGYFWFKFDTEVRSAEYILNRMGEALLKTGFIVLGMDEKIETLARLFKDNRFIIVWDNFEVVQGGRGTIKQATLKKEDRELLSKFLKKLRGGASKVIITSRSEEQWLGLEQRIKIDLGGLAGEERWEYCDRILGDLGIKIDRDDEDFHRLMDMLAGHPLVMRVILPRLEKMSPAAVIIALQSNIEELGLEGGEVEQQLWATLRLAEDALAEEQHELLIPLAMHERFVDRDWLKAQAKATGRTWTVSQIDTLFEKLSGAGLLRLLRGDIYEVHPALTGYLRSRAVGEGLEEEHDTWARAFVGVMASIVNDLTPKPLNRQRAYFRYHRANFYYAADEASRLNMGQDFTALLQGLAVYAQNMSNYEEAAEMFGHLAETHKTTNNRRGEAAAYHRLGMIAQERHDFGEAQKWYRKSLAINENLGDEDSTAATYNQLGMIAQEQRDFEEAEKCYQKAVAVAENLGNEDGMACTYHQLGTIAQERRDFEQAQDYYQKSLAIEEKLGNEHRAAMTYYQLGIIAWERRDLSEAEGWCYKALAISEKFGDEHQAAMTHHQLGVIAQDHRDFDNAQKWYQQSLAIKERLGDEHGAATTYHQLGRIAEEHRDFTHAQKWYQKSLVIKERLGDEHGAAMTYHQLGRIAEERRDFDEAQKWYEKSLAVKEKLNDECGAAMTYHQLGRIAEDRCDFGKAQEWYHKALAINQKLGDEHRVAITYHHLGRVAQELRNFEQALQWYEKSLAIKEKHGNKRGAAMSFGQLGLLAWQRKRFVEAGQWLVKSIATFAKTNDSRGVKNGVRNFLGIYRDAPTEDKKQLKRMFEQAGFGDIEKLLGQAEE